MTAPLQISSLQGASIPPGPLHLAIGMFDGVHLGHRAVIGPAVENARRDRGVAAVLTFWPHPSALFRPENATRLIQDPPTKARVLGEAGIELVISEHFTPEFARIEAEQFLPWLKQKLPTLAAVYVGDNFRFGQKRRGDAAMLIRIGREIGIAVSSAQRIEVEGEAASSTRIRAHLEAGEIEAANALLGYSYFSTGVVTTGKRLGRTLGFPTLNLGWSPDLRPRLGVYAVRVAKDDRSTIPGSRSGKGALTRGLPAVANYGLRPTVENAAEPKLEVHVLGDCPFDAGDSLLIEWLHFIRPEMKFGNLDALRAQISRDRDAAAAMLK